MNKPTNDQVNALAMWAQRYGRRWKSELRAAWFGGNYQGFGDLSCYLQQVRNDLGGTWLERFRLPGTISVDGTRWRLWLSRRPDVFQACQECNCMPGTWINVNSPKETLCSRHMRSLVEENAGK